MDYLLPFEVASLLFTFLGVTGLYIFLWADFLAVVQVVVYIGGILVLIIFGIMLTNKITSVNISHTSMQKGIGAVVAIGFIASLGYMAISSPWLQAANTEPAETTASIGRLLLMDYLLPFEVASVLLLMAMIGAIVLARRDVMNQDISTGLPVDQELIEKSSEQLLINKN